MGRLAPMLLVLALLGGTAAAFAVTEGLKLTPSAIQSTKVDKVFSPLCRCPTRVARIAFRLRQTDRLTVAIVDSRRQVVRTLADGLPFRRGFHHFAWNGRDDAGRILPQGSYRPRVHLSAAQRTILLPNPIRLDTRPPRVTFVRVAPRVFSPGGSGVVVRYRVDEPAHLLVYVDGRLRVFGRFERRAGQLEWYGKVGERALPAGAYRLAVAAQDAAGNRSRPEPVGAVQIRYIALGRKVIRARAGTLFGVRVLWPGPYRWSLLRGFGTPARWLEGGLSTRGLLVLRAPRKAGRYSLEVQSVGHSARALLVVRPRR